jgi:hypothetical protein
VRKADGTPVGGQSWKPIKIGGLGFITGGSIAADGSLMVCKTDVGGAYRRVSGSEVWSQLITTQTMTIPAPTSPSGGGTDFGVYEIAIAPSDATKVLMAFRGRMLLSTNGGATFADDALNGSTGLFMEPNTGGGTLALNNRLVQHKLKFDPSNANVAYLGTQRDGLWQRLSTGWAKITSVPAATFGTIDSDRSIIIAIDPTSTTTGTSPNVRKSVVYASSNGQGFYKSTDGGATFSLVTGHPGAGAGYASSSMVVDQNGKIWLVLDSASPTINNVYTSSNGGTTWTQITNLPTYYVTNLEVDPKDVTRLVGLCSSGKPFYSSNSGTSWVGAFEPIHNWCMPTGCPIAASEVQFQLQSQDAGACNILPHPTQNKDFIWGGYGVYFLNSPWPAAVGTKALIRYEDTKGVEELVAYHVSIHPDGTTFCCAGDRGVIVQDKTGKFATNNWPNGSLTDATNVDYAIDNHNYLVQQTHRPGLSDFSGFSTDKGLTWTAFPTQPNGTGAGGHIAISNTNQIVSFRSMNVWPRYTHDGGSTWNDCVFSGFSRVADGTENGWGFGNPFSYRRHIVCADKNNPGTFYAYCYGAVAGTKGIWKSTDGGVNWSLVGDPGTTSFGWHAGLFMTPNGHLYLFTGPLSSDFSDDGTLQSFRSEDGGVTWTALVTISEVNCLAWGAPKPGSAIPYALYAFGWLSGVFGLYRSDDKGATWITLTNNTNFDWPRCLDADPTVFGRLVAGYTGTGFFECLDHDVITFS